MRPLDCQNIMVDSWMENIYSVCSDKRYYIQLPQGNQGCSSEIRNLLFILYIENLDQQVSYVKFPFYADDTVMYCAASIATEALNQRQKAFNDVQHTLCTLKQVLNANKKLEIFKRRIKVPESFICHHFPRFWDWVSFTIHILGYTKWWCSLFCTTFLTID